MNEKIWRVLSQILSYRTDLSDLLRPFFVNLKNENINDKKYTPLLLTFFNYQIELLYQTSILTKETFSSYQNKSSSNFVNDNQKIKAIILEDNIEKLTELIQEKGINTFNIITKSFNEVEKMEIPLIQYCIMEKAIRCFKYLLVNGYDDPNKVMKEEKPYSWWKRQHRYEWDCMTTAIYLGNNEIIKILEEKGIEKGKNPVQIEAAILSYRNIIVEEILEEMNKKKEKSKNHLNIALLASAKSNNINEFELLIMKGVNPNLYDERLN